MYSIVEKILLIIILLNLLTVASNIYFVLYENLYLRDKYNINSIDDIIINTMILSSEALFLILYFCNSINYVNRFYYYLSRVSLIGLIVLTIISIISFSQSKNIFNHVIFTVIISSAALFGGAHSLINESSIIQIEDIYICTNIISMALLIGYLVILKVKKDYKVNVGIVFMIFGIVCMGIFLFSYDKNNISVYIINNLTLSFFMTSGFYIYYCKLYTNNLCKSISKIRKQNEKLIKAEKRIEKLAYINQDTNLKNTFKLQEDLLRAKNLKSAFVIGFDNLPQIINLLGHKKCIEKLNEIGEIISQNISSDEELYSVYNNKFIVTSKQDISKTKEMALKLINILDNNSVYLLELDTYIGATEILETPVIYDSLVSELEIASDVAKESDNSYSLYNYEMFESLQKTLNIKAELKNATDNNEWDMYLQPKIEVDTNKIVGAEALIRWRGKEREVTPNIFIPLAEEMGLIVEIGEYILKKSFQYLSEVNDRKNFTIAINLSCYQLMDSNFINTVDELKKEYNINPNNITFEITESVLINNFERVNDIIKKLRLQGFRFSLDDFGTGYSSISYLSRLEFDEIKFDKEFIDSIADDYKNYIILEKVAIMASKLGLEVVSEGIENKVQLESVKKIGCKYYQGYYYSKPVPFEQFLELLVNEKEKGN